MDSGLKGKKVLITGGGSGIGRGIALALAKEGVNIAIASRNPSQETIEEIKSLKVQALRLCVDVSDETQVIKMAEEAIDKLGGLDIYINNAAWAWHQPVTKISTKNWLKTINTNLSACVWACREVSKHMIAQRSGTILIIGSTALFAPLYKEASYRVSKTGLKVYMETLALEMAPFGIRVNMIIPGHFPTKLTAGLGREKEKIMVSQIPLRRLGNPEEDIGPTATLLLSDKLSSYTTASTLVIDGGLKLRPLPLYSDEEIRQMNL